MRAAAERGAEPPADDEILARAIGARVDGRARADAVINATGVVLHTGLGRAPLPEAAARRPPGPPDGYADLEVDRETGRAGPAAHPRRGRC